MRAALWVLALFALAVAITLAARLDQGYVIVVYPPWRLELSFMLALLLLTGLVAPWREKKRKGKADQALLDAIRAYLDGDLQQAGVLASEAAESTLAPDLVQRLQRPAPAESATPPAA